MAFDVSLLTAYIDQSKEPLIGKAVLASKSAKLLTLQTGVKYQTALNLLTSDTVLQSGESCGWSSQGSTNLTQRLITAKPIKINKAYCDKTLYKYWMNYQVKIGAGTATLPFEQQLVETEIAAVGEALEQSIWQGDVSLTGSTNLKQFDGLIKIFAAATGTTGTINAVNTGITGVTTSNAIQIVDNVYAAIPAQLLSKTDVKIFCGSDFFRTYTMALRTANLYHYSADSNNQELVIPGTSITLVAVDGLNGTNKLYAFSLANVFYGTDLEGDEEKFNLRYSEDYEEFRLTIAFTAGVQVAFPSEVVAFKLA